MRGVDEELRTSRVGPSGVGHRKRADFVGELRAGGLSELIGHGAVTRAGDGALARDLVSALGSRAAGAGAARRGVSGVGAAELVHEVLNIKVEGEHIISTI